MSRLIAYACNNDSLTQAALKAFGAELDLDSLTAPSGVGIGWVQGDRSLLRTNPKPLKPAPSILHLMSDVPGRATIGYVRDGSLGVVRAVNLQPFRFQRWVYAHVGGVSGAEALRARLPEHILRNIKGDSASEVIFHALVDELRRSDLLKKTPIRPQAVVTTLAEAVSEMESQGAVENLQIVLGTYRRIFAIRLGAPLYVRVIRGLEVKEEPIFAGHRPKAKKYSTFRAMLIVNGPRPVGWEEVPDRRVVWLDDAWNLRFEPIA